MGSWLPLPGEVAEYSIKPNKGPGRFRMIKFFGWELPEKLMDIGTAQIRDLGAGKSVRIRLRPEDKKPTPCIISARRGLKLLVYHLDEERNAYPLVVTLNRHHQGSRRYLLEMSLRKLRLYARKRIRSERLQMIAAKMLADWSTCRFNASELSAQFWSDLSKERLSRYSQRIIIGFMNALRFVPIGYKNGGY